ncbi:hypothetical protein [Geodermatophilus sp. URMC 64]
MTGPPRPRALPGEGRTAAENAAGSAAVEGSLRALTARLVPLSRRGRRQRGRVAAWTTPTVQFYAALDSSVEAARRADAHRDELPPRPTPWSLPTLLLVMAVLTAGDYLGVNAILRAANLPARASFTLPLVISVTILVTAKVLAHWDLGSVVPRRQDAEDRPQPAEDAGLRVVTARSTATGVRAGAYEENERRLQALAGPVARRKRTVLYAVLVLTLLGVIGLIAGLGALGGQLSGSLGLNDGEHDTLLLVCTFGLTAGIVLLNVSAAFALAYGQYVPGSAEYRAAVRNALVKRAWVRLLCLTARPERGSRRLVERLRAEGERADVRAALGTSAGLQDVFDLQPARESVEAGELLEDMVARSRAQTPAEFGSGYDERVDGLGGHLRRAPAQPQDAGVA